jgi:hypothetical protein
MNKTILQKAHEIIYGDREKTYGSPLIERIQTK